MADKILSSCAERLLDRKLFSTIILSGKGFARQDWAPEFMRAICSRRKVYAEAALFSQGAALRAADYLQEKTSYPFTCICEGRLKSTVSMQVVYKDRVSQLVVAAAGENWYESKSTMEFILDGSRNLEFVITPMDPKKKRTETVELDGFPQRPPRTTRIQVNVGFLSDSVMALSVRDKGFGEIFEATDAVVRREVRL